jgi:membrane-associated protease RseP (regulator of RpoE activity)
VEPLASHLPSSSVFRTAVPQRSRGLLHLLLLVVTFATLLAAGGVMAPEWAEVPPALGPPAAFGWLAAHPAVAGRLAASALTYALWVLAILGAHEMGHYLACRRYRIPATLPFFIPGVPPIGTFGAVIRIRGAIPDRKALFDVAAAGPLAGFVVALPALAWGLKSAEPVAPELVAESGMFLGEPFIVALLGPLVGQGAEHVFVNPAFMAGWVGILVTSLNLFPVGQLDGGHAAYAVSARVHRVVSRLTLIAMLGAIAFQLLSHELPSYLLWFGILVWMRDRHPRLVDERAPLGRGRVVLATLLAVLFLICFIPFPFRVV